MTVKSEQVAELFVEVPERSSEDIDALVLEISDHRITYRSSSYGAYLIRGSSQEDARTIARNLKQEHVRGVIRGQLFEDGFEKPIHTDKGASLLINDVTAHRTTLGVVEALVLVDGQLAAEAGSFDFTRTLFESGLSAALATYPGEVTLLPSRILHVMLGVNDLLVFDHTQPHAFRSRSPQRISDITYIT